MSTKLNYISTFKSRKHSTARLPAPAPYVYGNMRHPSQSQRSPHSAALHVGYAKNKKAGRPKPPGFFVFPSQRNPHGARRNAGIRGSACPGFRKLHPGYAGLHKTTTTISKNYAVVVIEDLQVRNMSKSAAGTVDQPGRNVNAKSGLNRSILDQGWFESRRQLEYKQAWLGGDVLAVPPRNTSRTCPACGHVAAENRQAQARFACMECGFAENPDLVGAINVLRAGHARLACEVNGAAMPSAAGTRRSDPSPCGLGAVGIPFL